MLQNKERRMRHKNKNKNMYDDVSVFFKLGTHYYRKM